MIDDFKYCYMINNKIFCSFFILFYRIYPSQTHIHLSRFDPVKRVLIIRKCKCKLTSEFDSITSISMCLSIRFLFASIPQESFRILLFF